MTRGRDGNHAYITPDPTIDPEHDHGHSPAARKHTDQDPLREANGVLTAALAQSGGAERRPHRSRRSTEGRCRHCPQDAGTAGGRG